MENLNFSYCNVNGLGSVDKLWKLREYFQKNSLDFMVLAETKIHKFGIDFFKIFSPSYYDIRHITTGQGLALIKRKNFNIASFSDLSIWSTFLAFQVISEMDKKLLFIYQSPSASFPP